MHTCELTIILKGELSDRNDLANRLFEKYRGDVSLGRIGGRSCLNCYFVLEEGQTIAEKKFALINEFNLEVEDVIIDSLTRAKTKEEISRYYITQTQNALLFLACVSGSTLSFTSMGRIVTGGNNYGAVLFFIGLICGLACFSKVRR